MALDSGIVNACDVVIKLDNAAGVLQDISGSSNEVGFNFDADIAEFTVFGYMWYGRLCCRKKGAVSMNLWCSTTADQGFDIIKNWWDVDPCALRTLEVFIPDDTAGSDKWSGEFMLAHFDFTASSDEAGPIAVKVDLLPREAIHLTAVAS